MIENLNGQPLSSGRKKEKGHYRAQHQFSDDNIMIINFFQEFSIESFFLKHPFKFYFSLS